MKTQDKLEKANAIARSFVTFLTDLAVYNPALSVLAGMTSTGLSFSATWSHRLFAVAPHKVELQKHT